MLETVPLIAGSILLGWVVVMVVLRLLSRRPDHLGVRDGRLTPCPASPNCVCSQDSDGRHGIAPLAFSGDPAAAWQRLQGILARQPRCRIVTVEPGYLRAEFTS